MPTTSSDITHNRNGGYSYYIICDIYIRGEYSYTLGIYYANYLICYDKYTSRGEYTNGLALDVIGQVIHSLRGGHDNGTKYILRYKAGTKRL